MYVLCFNLFSVLLMSWNQAPKLPVRANDSGEVFVANLSSHPISSVEEFDILYRWVASEYFQ